MHLIFHAPQILWVIFTGIGLILSIFFHEQEKTFDINPTIHSITMWIVAALQVLFFYWGGVFSTMGIPQVIILIAIGIELISNIPMILSGEASFRVNAFSRFSFFIMNFGILYWAGFFGGGK